MVFYTTKKEINKQKKPQTLSRVVEGGEKFELLYIVGWIVKLAATLENRLEVSQNVKHRVTISPSNFIARYISKRIKNICPYRKMDANVHCSITANSKKVEATQM